jgi:hypothetical protein
METTQLAPIEVMRTKAWFAEILLASGATTPYQLKKMASDERGRSIKYDYYRTGERTPSEETLSLIEQSYGLAPLAVFRMGPDGAPLWAVLSGDESACREAVVDWLKVARDPRLATDPVAQAFTTLEDKVSLAFRTLGLEQPKGISDSPGFLYTYELPPQPKEDPERYYRPELASQVRATSTPWFVRESVTAFLAKDERVALSSDVRAAFVRLAAESPIASAIRSYAGPFPTPSADVLPDAVTGVFALRTLAVRRGELIRETAYLVDVLRPLLPAIFEEWKIGEDLAEYVRED